MRRILLVGVMVALVATACSSSSDSSDTTVPDTSSTTTSTTAATTTSTTVADTTTTTQATTTTTTTVADSTTTSFGGSATTLELSTEGIQAGLEWVYFGYDADDAVAAVEVVIGPADDDTGWLDSYNEGWEHFGGCPGPRVRGVSWGSDSRRSLTLLFTDGDTDFWVGGVPHLFTFYYFDGSNPRGVKTKEGIGIGSTVGQLRATYGGPDFFLGEAFWDPAQGDWSYKQGHWTGLWGYTTGLTDEYVVGSINGGQGCGE